MPVSAGNDHVALPILNQTHSCGGCDKTGRASPDWVCRALNSLVRIDEHVDGLHPGNALDIMAGYDVIVDASDNPPTRYLVRYEAV
jgi:hypothetical protein